MGANMRKFSTIFMNLRTAAFLPIVTTLSIGLGSLTPIDLARADTIFTNFGPSQSYDKSQAWAVTPTQSVGFSFVSSGFYNVTQIDLALFDTIANGSNPNASAIVSLWTNAANSLGTNLGTWSVSGFPVYNLGGSGLLTTISGITDVSLVAGASYFLQVEAPGRIAWMKNITGNMGVPTLLSGSTVDFPDTPASSFDIMGDVIVPTPTPLPAALPMFAAGTVLVGLMIRRRKQQARRAN